ncbi:MAG: hypothetical protein KGQ43_07795 [Acidobacteria bacterium]|nr:hypothetical protein [Acidobacteriota bacterium]
MIQSGKLFTAGMYLTCLGSSVGTVKCWGDNWYGQIGNGSGGTGTHVATPATVSGLTGVREVVAGAYHVCALLADTTVKCWGYNIAGQLGTGDTNNSNVPVHVKSSDGNGVLTGVASISASYFNTCASMISNGSVYCWGDQGGGALGNGQTAWAAVKLPAAVQVSGGAPLTGITELSGGMPATCGISTNATLYCWGTSTWAAGDGTNAAASFAKQVPGLTGVKSVSVGGAHVCALATGGAFCWGGTTDRPFGDTPDFSSASAASLASPSLVRASGVSQIVAGYNATCILQTDKKVQCVGYFFGDDASTKKSALGGDSVGRTASFTDVPGLSNATLVVLGGNHGCAQSSAGLSCWGRNNEAQLGGGSRTTPNQPVTLAVASQPQTVTFADVPAKNVGSDPFDVTATADTGRPVRFTIAASSAAVCSVDGAKVTILDSGDCVINATVDGEGMYAETTESKTVPVAALAPVVTTGDASVLTMNSATLAGTSNPRGASTSLSFEYGTDAALASSTSAAVKGARVGNFLKSATVDLTGLSVATTYYYRIVATNAVGTSRGEIKSFTTKGSKPTATTGSASRATAGMTVNGKVNPKDLETTVRFEYGTDPKLVGAQQTAAKTQTGAEDVDVTAVLTGLSENTTYYYRVTATNIVGTTDGDIKSFITTRPEGVSINDGDEFTSSENVTVSVVGPSTAVKAILSNDGGFKTTETFDLTNNSADIPWKLQSSREGTFTKIVYVKYVSRFGSQSQAVTDDIILDTTKPVLATATAAAAAPTGSAVQVSRIGTKAKASGGVRLSLRGSDTISGIGTIEVRSAANKPAAKVKVSRVAGKADGKPRAASQTVTLRTTAKRLQVRVIDRAGNASAWRTITVR